MFNSIIYVSVWYLNPEAQNCKLVGELELELGTQADNVQNLCVHCIDST